MTEDTYVVIIDGVVIARGMGLNNALLFTKALFKEYYNDTDLQVSVKREDTGCDECVEEPDRKLCM